MDLIGRLSNPPYNFGRMIDQMPNIRKRPPRPRKQRNDAQPSQRRLSDDERRGIIDGYCEGSSVTELTKTFGLHRTTVLSILERNDVPRRPNRPKLNESEVAQAKALYQSGHSLARVGARLDVDPSTVANTLKRSGVILRPRRGWPIPKSD